ncbi:hypothetical protein MMC28_005595 [Mycoblastus sanguinarius]|nr:hypothetical protein [Mycoblastus sanguinarius]
MSDGSVPAAANKGGGFIQDRFDSRDQYYQAQASTQPPAFLNLREDHAQLANEIYDQGDTGSCTANAAAAAFWYEEKAGCREKVWGSAGPSRLFIYWLARGGYKKANHDIKNVSDSGSFSRDAMKGIAKVGACSEADCPFVDFDKINGDVSGIKPKLKRQGFEVEVKKRVDEIVNAKPSNAAFSSAAPHKITSYYRLDPDRPDAEDGKLNTSQKDKIGSTLLENIKKCLTEGFPVAFGFWYYLPGAVMFDETKEPYVLKDVWNMPNSKFPRHTFPENLPNSLRIKDEKGKVEQPSPGHSVLAIGYDESRQQVLVQNSWGKTWSGNGTFWMPYAWITDFAATNDFWTIRTTHTLPDNPPKLWQDVHQEIIAAA